MVVEPRQKLFGIDLIFYPVSILILLAACFHNRALIIGYLVALSSIYFMINPLKSRKKAIVIVSSVFIITTILLGLWVKKDSTNGRLLIYKLSFKILKNTFPRGIGANNFGVVYGRYQIDHFKQKAYTQKEFLLADNVLYTYNDYLQFVIEHGIVGLSFLLIFIILIGFMATRSLSLNDTYPVLLLLAYTQIVALCIAACFTFIFYQLHWQCVFLLAFGVLLYYNSPGKLKYIISINSIIIICIVISHFSAYIFHYQSCKKRIEAEQLFKAGYFDDANRLYKQIYPVFENDYVLTRLYTKSLLLSGKSVEAENLMSHLILKEDNSFNYDILAECYKNNMKYRQAENAYRNAIYKVPNRFMSRFNLFIFYMDRKQPGKAIEIGNEILKLPVKIPSDHIDQIKIVVSNQLKNIEK